MKNYKFNNFTTDGNGDTYSKKYDQYVNADILMDSTLTQLEKNFEDVYEHEPSAEDMKKSLKLMYLFLAEIGETCATTIQARAASEISLLINEDNPIETAENISHYVTINHLINKL